VDVTKRLRSIERSIDRDAARNQLALFMADCVREKVDLRAWEKRVTAIREKLFPPDHVATLANVLRDFITFAEGHPDRSPGWHDNRTALIARARAALASAGR
jgi:hypothetical protein